MGHGLREILTLQPLRAGKPLFESAAELAGQISKDQSSRFRKPQTVATLLSNLLRGHRPCSEELAEAILAAVQKRLQTSSEHTRKTVLVDVGRAIENANAEFRTRSAGKLPSVASSRAVAAIVEEMAVIEVPQRVPQLFLRVGEAKGLVCVDYRDYPRAYPEGEYYKMAVDVGQAVAQGGCFAMFQPYGDAHKDDSEFYHTLEVRNYLENLTKLVQSAFCYILAAAFEAKIDNEPDLEIAKRIVLYQRGIPESLPCHAFLASGIQSRLFYAEIPAQDEGKADQEVWEWVATGDEIDDVFVQRSDDSIPKQVVRDQFFPVVRYWKKHKGLLNTNAEIETAINLCNEEAGAKLPKNFWTVFLTPEEAIVKVKALGKL